MAAADTTVTAAFTTAVLATTEVAAIMGADARSREVAPATQVVDNGEEIVAPSPSTSDQPFFCCGLETKIANS